MSRLRARIPTVFMLCNVARHLAVRHPAAGLCDDYGVPKAATAAASGVSWPNAQP